MKELKDAFGRKIDYLRISVTDRCNLSCRYCMPEGGLKAVKNRSHLLTFEEIARLSAILALLGVTRIRLTGGEPLARRDITKLVGDLSAILGVEDLSLTTNGLLLKDLAAPLKAAGLHRVNISLDSLNAEKYAALSRGGDLRSVLCGIEKAIEVGLTPVKINVVLIKGVNDGEDDLAAFLELRRRLPVHIRFIEHMRLAPGNDMDIFVSIAEARRLIDGISPLKEAANPPIGAGPAKYYQPDHLFGTVGFISAMSEPFCESCNRLRLSAAGSLMTCLFSSSDTNLLTLLRSGASDDEIVSSIKRALMDKAKDRKGFDCGGFDWQMSKIGG